MGKGAAVAFLAVLLSLFIASSQDTGATIQLGESETLGAYLVDAEGLSLYLYQEDSPNTSTCYDRCVNNWPPLTTEGEPVAGEGVDASLLGTTQRDDGLMQVTYNGWPLYRYARDAEPGDTRGQALGEVFFLVSPTGEAALPPVPEPEAEAEAEAEPVELDEATAALVAEGKPTFTGICAACHGAEGQGKVGPPFNGNSNLADTEFVVKRILNGFPEHSMPAFRDRLSDRQIAAVATFIRNSWSNHFGAVTEEEVSARR